MTLPHLKLGSGEWGKMFMRAGIRNSKVLKRDSLITLYRKRLISHVFLSVGYKAGQRRYIADQSLSY
jgi:hypothetical protein